MLAYPRTLTVSCTRSLGILLADTKCVLSHIKALYRTVESDHILLELDIVAFGIAEHKPCLTVIVYHNSRVDVIPIRTAERLAEDVLVRSLGFVSNADAYRSAVGSCCEIEVILAISLDTL